MINKIYKKLPVGIKSNISKANYILSGKPKYKRDSIRKKKFPKGFRGGIIITADFELGWALRYSKTGADPVEYAMRERKNVPIILDIARKYNIPITWATVGHLFLEECKRGAHDWMHRLPYFDDHWKYTEGDWFDCDPYTNWEKGKAWYAPDLIKKIIDEKVGHEIACHTFSHIDCSYKNCPAEVIDDELKASQNIVAEWNLPHLTSIAFPGGTAGNFETLIKYRINIYRKRFKEFEMAYPFKDEHGLIVTPTGPNISLGYNDWSLDYNFQRFKKGINKAIKTGTILHLWFHPSQPTEGFTDLMPLIFSYAEKLRSDGKLWIGTMRDIADHINSNKILD
ncbi:MAG: polysaccharide deacetylase family protein [Bacteroidales bacterium]|nr:polysaccharide deacetylase family protein [Bacteroidales bacterium]MCF8402543.1 polysaccharide deacetylase family protein [Bacteroidales bacterium]